ncbi:hypothetical protein ACTD5D_41110 [Nocardia takedensis]|uniref:hypothetical protein n=1 Tax=Nocardia takedensis TaxID=259390 RepID=UPI003F75A759
MKTFSLRRRTTAAASESVDTTPLHDRVQEMRDRLAVQADPALLEAYSERELAADRSLAERERDSDRNERAARIEAAEKASARLRRTVDALADQQARDMLDAERAIAQQRHSSSPHTKVARLHRRRTMALRIITGVLVIAMVISAVSVQQNIAPNGGPTNIWWWMAYGIEFLISGTLIALMMSTGDSAEWDVIEEPWKARTIENILLGVTVALNIFPYLPERNWGQVGAHVIAPVIIGTALHTYSVVATRYGRSIDRATAQLSEGEHEDIATRLAALTRIGALAQSGPAAAVAPTPVRALPEPAVRVETTPIADEPAPAPQPAVRAEETRSAGEPAPAPEPAVRAEETRSAGETDPAPEPAARAEGDVGADPAPVVRIEENTEVEAGAGTRTDAAENVGVDNDSPSVPAPAVRPRTTPHRAAFTSRPTAPRPTQTRTDRAPEPAVRAQTRSGAGTGAGAPRTSAGTGSATAAAPAVRAELSSPMLDLAAAVKARGVAKTKDVETVAAVITAIDAGERNNAIATAAPTKMSHSTVEGIRQAVSEIRNAHGGGRVIEMRRESETRAR